MAARGRGASRRSRRDAAASSDMRLPRARLSSRSDERVPRRAPLKVRGPCYPESSSGAPGPQPSGDMIPATRPGAGIDALDTRAHRSERAPSRRPSSAPSPRLDPTAKPTKVPNSIVHAHHRVGTCWCAVHLRADPPAFARRSRRRPLLRVLLPELRRRAAVGARDPVERGLRRHVSRGGTRGCQDIRADPRRSEEGGGCGTDAGAVPARGTGPGVQVHGRP